MSSTKLLFKFYAEVDSTFNQNIFPYNLRSFSLSQKKEF